MKRNLVGKERALTREEARAGELADRRVEL